MRCLLCTRYGKVMLMTDQDHDGSHIKGLFFNMIHHFWPELLQRNDFICEFVTPIVKCFPAQREGAAARALEKSFFTLQEFSRWYQGLSDGEKRKWNVKYYKGLGTSSSKEGKEYFGTILKSDCVFLLFAVFQCLLHVPVCLIQNRALATYSKPRAAQVGHALLQRSRR